VYSMSVENTHTKKKRKKHPQTGNKKNRDGKKKQRESACCKEGNTDGAKSFPKRHSPVKD